VTLQGAPEVKSGPAKSHDAALLPERGGHSYAELLKEGNGDNSSGRGEKRSG